MATTTTESRAVKTLTKTMEAQKDKLSTLLNRVSTMADEIHVLKTDLNRFKTDVANDVKYLTERVDG